MGSEEAENKYGGVGQWCWAIYRSDGQGIGALKGNRERVKQIFDLFLLFYLLKIYLYKKEKGLRKENKRLGSVLTDT